MPKNLRKKKGNPACHMWVTHLVSYVSSYVCQIQTKEKCFSFETTNIFTNLRDKSSKEVNCQFDSTAFPLRTRPGFKLINEMKSIFMSTS